ncbi:MAG: hypothetical protein JNG85_11745 [Spirochaetaceae bacterium]|nr:hypothetical protein [Spirochaetaceae bacterium]
MKRLFILRAAAAAIALSAAVPAFAEISVETFGGYGTVGGALAGAAGGATFETLGTALGLRLSCDGEGVYARDGVGLGQGSATAQVAAGSGVFSLLGSIEGGAYAKRAGAGWLAGASLGLTLNGEEASASLVPRVLYDSGPEGFLELGGRLAASFLAGDAVLKPEMDLAWQSAADGSTAFALSPGLGFSWYPGFPVAAAFGAGWRRVSLATGSTVDSVPAFASLYGAAGRALSWSVDASLEFGLADLTLFAAMAEAELGFAVGRFAGGEVVLPLALSWDLDADEGFAVRAGLRVALD